MAIQLDDGARTSTPVVKRTKIGEAFLGAIVKTEQRDVKNNGDTVMNERTGKPRQELVVTCVALPGTTAPAGIKDTTAVPEAGEIVRLILRGGAFGQWIEARNAHRGGKLQVGDVVKQVVDHAQAYDAAGSKRGAAMTDQAAVDALPRGVTIGFYGPLTLHEPKDQTWVAKAEEAYHAATAIVLDEPANGRSAADVFGDDLI
jgi:hypothetical protein